MLRRAYQSDYHEVAPTETAAFGNNADPTYFSQFLTMSQYAKHFAAERQSKEAKATPNGGIHVSEEIWLHRPIKLDEVVTMCPEASEWYAWK